MKAPGNNTTPRMKHLANVATLKRLGILDTAAERGFDAVVRAAARLFDAPTALVSLLDLDRQWFKAREGLDARETPLSMSFCRFATRTPDVMVVPDASQDPRFVGTPLVAGPPFIRFYAGAPLVTQDGFAIGTLCILDPAPRRTFPDADRATLADLAHVVVELIEGRAARLLTSDRSGIGRPRPAS